MNTEKLKQYEFFTTENKSGYKTNEKWLKTNNPDLCKTILNFQGNKENIPFKQKIYNYLFDLEKTPSCKHCKKTPVKFRGKLKEGYNQFCSIKCTNQSVQKKENTTKSIIKKYGVESHNQLASVKEKKKETLFKNYGVHNMMHSDVLKERVKATNFKKYNAPNYPQSEEYREKSKLAIQTGIEKNIQRMLKRIPEGYKFIIYNTEINKLQFSCPDGHIFDINSNLINARLTLNKKICTVCNPINSFSGAHLEIVDFIESISAIEVKKNHRIENKELDIYLPSLNFGIEFNGVFWHSDRYLDDDYHYKKTKFFSSKGINMIHIFEDEWSFKTEIIKSIIRSKLNLSINKVSGRKCSIELLSKKAAKTFLEQNHLQGYVFSEYNYGLSYKNEIISLMSFSNKRTFIKKYSNNEFELTRFCNKLNYNVIGGASKLFQFFIKTHSPDRIISYCDKRFSKGNLYYMLGMEFIKETPPNYYYVEPKGIKRHHRYKFRKDVLVKEGCDKNKTERQIMNEKNYRRIYDCGNLKFEWKRKSQI